jgi:multicomponent Na+:H+ antiporter subunit G
MSEWITAILLLLGASFVLLAAVGIFRMPDLFSRLQVATKASTLGCGLALAGVAVHFATLVVVVMAMVVAAFILCTAPVAAHMIARAAYLVGVPLWKHTVVDELRDKVRPPRGPAGDQ